MFGTAIGAVVLTGIIEAAGWRNLSATVGVVLFFAAVFLLRDAEELAAETQPFLAPPKRVVREMRVW